MNLFTTDVLGICKQVSDIRTIVPYPDKEPNTTAIVRELHLIDESEHEVICTLWGEEAENFSSDVSYFPVIAIKKVKVLSFRGRSLSKVTVSQLQINPDIPECRKLVEWFQRRDTNQEYTLISIDQGL